MESTSRIWSWVLSTISETWHNNEVQDFMRIREGTHQFGKAIPLFSDPLVLESLPLPNLSGLWTDFALELFYGNRWSLSLGWACVPYPSFVGTLKGDLRTLLGEDMGYSFLGSVYDHLKEHGYIHTDGRNEQFTSRLDKELRAPKMMIWESWVAAGSL